ncbi:MAG: YbaY family lipoprotein [Dinoroseobacter sp.]|nr:YbaY family lipoprotein [Dinoroseobacter sp.]
MKKYAAVLLAMLLYALTAISAVAEDAMLDISIAYRERIALPPDAVVEVELLDVSRMDVAADRLSSQRFRMTSVPFEATLVYDPSLVDERLAYTVAARIYSQGRVMFRTTQAYPVLTRGSGSQVELILQMMPANDAEEDVPNLEGPVWQAFEVDGRAVVADRPPTLQFEKSGQFGLFSGCNNFRGLAEISDGEIGFGDNIAGTLMACPPGPAELERAILNAVSATVRYTLTSSGLTLLDAAGREIMRLQAQPAE